MIPLVELPTLVQHYAPFFAEVFSAEALVEFERYVSGLIVSENKTVDGINRLFVLDSRNQSSLNRLLTASPFALEALNQARRQVLASLPDTQLKPKGVLSVDDTLLTHYGQAFEQIAKLYDPVSESYVWAHDVVTLHYSDDLTDYPLRVQLWKPVDLAQLEAGLRAAGITLKADKEIWKESDPRKWRSYLVRAWRRRQQQHPQLRQLYASKLTLAQALLQTWGQQHPDLKLPVTFDDWYTQPEFCRFIDQTLGLPYVGTLSRLGQTPCRPSPSGSNKNIWRRSGPAAGPSSNRSPSATKARQRPTPLTAAPTNCTGSGNNAWSSTTARRTCRMPRPFSSATA